MKLNNKGFAITSIMYIILMFAVIVIALTLALLSSRKLILDKIKSEVAIEVNRNDICTPVTNKTKTTGNVPNVDSNGELIFNIGDEYICEVKEDVKHHFFILSIEDDKVNLIMDSNISINGEAIKSDVGIAAKGDDRYHTSWITEADYINVEGKNIVNHTTYGEMQLGYDKGPVTALKFLKQAVSNLTNIKSSYNVRLPYKSEINALFTDGSSMDNFNLTSLPLWAHNYMWNSTNDDNKYYVEGKTNIENLREYWLYDSKELNSTITTDDYAAYTVGYDNGWYGYTATFTDGYAGVRFVMSIPKEELKKKSVNAEQSICKLVSDEDGSNSITRGDKYKCEVKPGTFFNFYVVSYYRVNGMYDLIMERNICEDGTVATKTNRCLVAWYVRGEDKSNPEDYNGYGPTTAMQYLYNATKQWKNVTPSTSINYSNTYQYNGYYFGYHSFSAVDGIITIKSVRDPKDESNANNYPLVDTVIGTKEEPARARMPIYNELGDYDGTASKEGNRYFYDYLKSYSSIQKNSIEGIYGYWTISTYAIYTSDAYAVNYKGVVSRHAVNTSSMFGVRPVINVEL